MSCSISILTRLCVGYLSSVQRCARIFLHLCYRIPGRANWIGHILLRKCLLQQVIEGQTKGGIEVTERPRRRRKKIVGELKDRRGYCHLKEEALDHTMWRHRFGGGFGPIVRQNTE